MTRPHRVNQNNADREILLLQIVSFPKDEDAAVADEHWLYQLTVPVSVMLNVRGTGQTLRNQAE
jgi:hypothetical protein